MKQNDIYIKWYHWLWIWVIPTESVVDISRKKTYEMHTTMYYKRVGNDVYIVKTTYTQHKIPNARQVRNKVKRGHRV